MNSLQVHGPTPTTIAVAAEILFSPHHIDCRFQIEDSLSQVEDGLTPSTSSIWSRADNLWTSTCFEAFWGPERESVYWELNLSPARQAWNVYRFESYRTPQPPAASSDFELVAVSCDGRTVHARLAARLGFAPVRVHAGLCAVIRTATDVHYFAIAHPGDKPDFHDRRGFVLEGITSAARKSGSPSK